MPCSVSGKAFCPGSWTPKAAQLGLQLRARMDDCFGRGSGCPENKHVFHMMMVDVVDSRVQVFFCLFVCFLIQWFTLNPYPIWFFPTELDTSDLVCL